MGTVAVDLVHDREPGLDSLHNGHYFYHNSFVLNPIEPIKVSLESLDFCLQFL